MEQVWKTKSHILKEALRLFSQKGDRLSADPQMMPLHFFLPLFLLLDPYSACPEKESEALEMLDRHITQLCKIYGKTTEPTKDQNFKEDKHETELKTSG